MTFLSLLELNAFRPLKQYIYMQRMTEQMTVMMFNDSRDFCKHYIACRGHNSHPVRRGQDAVLPHAIIYMFLTYPGLQLLVIFKWHISGWVWFPFLKWCPWNPVVRSSNIRISRWGRLLIIQLLVWVNTLFIAWPVRAWWHSTDEGFRCMAVKQSSS